MTFVLTLILAAAPVKLAVPDVQGVNITPELGRFYSTEVARFLRSEGLEVVSAADIASILGMERQKQLLGCGDGTSCMAELGSALGCDLILSLNLARLDDDSYRGSIRVLSSIDGRARAEEAVEGRGQRALLDALERASSRLAKKLLPQREGPPARSFAWVPLAGGAVAGLVGGISLGIAHGNYARIPTVGDLSTATMLAREGETAQALGWSMIGVGTGALLGALALFLFGGPADAPKASVSVSSTGASIQLQWVFR